MESLGRAGWDRPLCKDAPAPMAISEFSLGTWARGMSPVEPRPDGPPSGISAKGVVGEGPSKANPASAAPRISPWSGRGRAPQVLGVGRLWAEARESALGEAVAIGVGPFFIVMTVCLVPYSCQPGYNLAAVSPDIARWIQYEYGSA